MQPTSSVPPAARAITSTSILLDDLTVIRQDSHICYLCTISPGNTSGCSNEWLPHLVIGHCSLTLWTRDHALRIHENSFSRVCTYGRALSNTRSGKLLPTPSLRLKAIHKYFPFLPVLIEPNKLLL
jgi:hypothetical protein